MKQTNKQTIFSIMLLLAVLLLPNCKKENNTFFVDKSNENTEISNVTGVLKEELDDFENNSNRLKALKGFTGINAIDRTFSHDYRFLNSFSFNFSSEYIKKGETAFILLYNNSSIKTKRLIVTESKNGTTIRQKTVSLLPKKGYYFYCFLSKNTRDHVNTLYRIHPDTQDTDDFTARIFTEPLSNFWYSPYNAFPQTVQVGIPTYLHKELNQYGAFTGYDENHTSEYYVYSWSYKGSKMKLGALRAKFYGRNNCEYTKYTDKYVLIHRMLVNVKVISDVWVYFDHGQKVYAQAQTLDQLKPSNLKLIARTSNTVKFSWDVVPGAPYYHIWRRIPGHEGIRRIKKISANRSVYTDYGLTGNTRYQYFVQAEFSASNSTSFSKGLFCSTLN